MDILPPKVQNLLRTGRAGWANVPRPGSIGSVTVPAEAGSILVERATGCIIVTDDRTPIKRTEKVVFQRAIRIDRDDYREKANKFEGYVTHMYLDCKGLVTVGIGHRIPDVETAMAMRFFDRGTVNDANEVHIKNAYNMVLESGLICKHYSVFENMTHIDLDLDLIEKLFDDDVREFLTQLSVQFRDFETYPATAQLGMLDLAYNMGTRGFSEGFPVFKKALEIRNWIKVAEESHRKEVDDKGEVNTTMHERNHIVRNWFLEAIKVEPFFLNRDCPAKRLSMM